MTITKETLLAHRAALTADRNNHLTAAKVHREKARSAEENAMNCNGAIQQVDILLAHLEAPEPKPKPTLDDNPTKPDVEKKPK